MTRFFQRPGLHFFILGLALFYAKASLFPAPLPSVGPLPDTRVENLKRQWFSATGRVPSARQLQRMIDAELDREVLFREGLALEIHRHDPIVRQRLVRNMRFLGVGEERDDESLYQEALRMELHLGDEVVKRRLIQVMEQMLLARRPPPAPTAADIAEAFQQRREELRLPPRYTIAQVFLTRERAEEGQALLERISEQSLEPARAMEFSSPFLPGYRFDAQSPAQLARHFGAAFVLNFEQLSPEAGQWVGPVQSTYGSHLIWVEAIEPARDPVLEEVRERLVRDLELSRRREALAAAVADLRRDYEVLL